MEFIKKHKKAIIVAFFFFVATKLKNTSIMSVKKNYTKNDAKDALLRFSKKNYQRAKLLEKMYKAETRDFDSLQFKLTGSAGQEDGAWGNTVKKYFPNGYSTVPMMDNHTKKMRNFIVWNSIDDALQFLSDYIDRHNGDYLRWNAINIPANKAKRDGYQRLLNSIKNEFIL
jgi:hypothetical protein